jgi:hypothetical protein
MTDSMQTAKGALLNRAEAQHSQDVSVSQCWSLLRRGIELGWIEKDELHELVEYLESRRDWGVEELLFANSGSQVRVSFLDDEVTCDSSVLL